jgi:hypothetical protein
MSAPKDTMKITPEMLEGGKLTISEEKILENVRINIARPLPQLRQWPPNGKECVIAAGGPSLKSHFHELRDLHFERVPIIALNGAANFLMERNIRPSAFICMDGLPQNVEFVRRDIPGCKYFLASQCDPAVFDACEGRDVTIFHVNSTGEGENEEGPEKDLLDKHYHGRWQTVVGGKTVGLRGIWACRMMGYELMHIFGLDSCYVDDEHHAYEQSWDNDRTVFRVWVAGREFRCDGTHIAQAECFKLLAEKLGRYFHLQVHGDGLIAHMVKTGADISRQRTAA